MSGCNNEPSAELSPDQQKLLDDLCAEPIFSENNTRKQAEANVADFCSAVADLLRVLQVRSENSVAASVTLLESAYVIFHAGIAQDCLISPQDLTETKRLGAHLGRKLEEGAFVTVRDRNTKPGQPA
jgi:hypothetical protein